jgi:hypothetical protein
MALSLTRTGGVRVRDRYRENYRIQPQGIGLLCGQTEKEFLVAMDADGESAQTFIQEQNLGSPLPSTVARTYATGTWLQKI